MISDDVVNVSDRIVDIVPKDSRLTLHGGENGEDLIRVVWDEGEIKVEVIIRRRGEDRLSKSQIEALMGAIMEPDPPPERLSPEELAEVREHWKGFVKDENKADAALMAYSIGPMLEHLDLVDAENLALKAQVKELTEDLLDAEAFREATGNHLNCHDYSKLSQDAKALLKDPEFLDNCGIALPEDGKRA